jgi:hypothetical protein
MLDADEAAVFYTTTSITGPVGGVIVGGLVTTQVGGYNTYKAHRLMQFIGVMAVLCALPIPFVNFGHFAYLIWFVLFFGGFLLPQVTGIMLNSVDENKRTSANSVATLCYNLFGYLPAPSFYGMVSAIIGNPASRIPMGALLYSTFISISFLIIGINYKLNREYHEKLLNVPGGGTGETYVNNSDKHSNEQELVEKKSDSKIDTDSLLGTPTQSTYMSGFTGADQKKAINSAINKPIKYSMSPPQLPRELSTKRDNPNYD